MAITLDISPVKIMTVSLNLNPDGTLLQDFVLDGDGLNLLDGNGDFVFGWQESSL